MRILTILLVSIFPTALVVVGGWWILRKGVDSQGSRRFLLYLLVIAVLLIPVVFVIEQITPERGTRLAYHLSILITPLLLGVLALILVHIRQLAKLSRGDKVLAALLGLFFLVVMATSIFGRPLGIAHAILFGALLLAAVWVFLGSPGMWIFSLLTLAGMALYNTRLHETINDQLPRWTRDLIGYLIFILPGLAVALAALWVSTGLKLFTRPVEDSEPARPSRPWLPALPRMGMGAILLAALGYTTVWASIWDQTSDGLAGVMMAFLGSLVAIAAGMLMGITLAGWRRSAGLVFSVLVLVLMFGAFRAGWDISYHGITEARASRIQRALEDFHDQNDRYPDELGELVPNQLLWIPPPVILVGEGWCYQGGQDDYRLGAFYREYFSTPLSLNVYASAGSPPESEWACAERLVEMKARYDPPPFYEEDIQLPTEEPLPTSVIPIQRTVVQPLFRSRLIFPGSWSPDGQYLLFGSLASSGEERLMGLHFLNAKTGEVCHADGFYSPGSGLSEHHVWLPGGRLLFLSEVGEMVPLTPCEPGGENLASRYPAVFTKITATGDQGHQVLLQNQESFWIMDGESLEVKEIPGISPNPYELHWDQAAWSPGGEMLAISRLNGRDRNDGSTLYFVTGDGGVVESLSLPYASDQSPPMVEWLGEETLLLNGAGVLAIVDLRSDPVSLSHVLQDIFSLNISYPDEISSMASIVDPSGEHYHLAVRVNRPRNQDLYLYHSETGGVEVLKPEVTPILFFPDGAWTRLPEWSPTPPAQDAYELMWVDAPGRGIQRLDVQGHTPRSYPHLGALYLPRSSRMVFSSSQGISLVSIPDGGLQQFWELGGEEGKRDLYLRASPGEEVLVAIAERVAFYIIPLPH